MAGKEHTIFKSYLFWTLDEEKEQKECIKEMMIEDAEDWGTTVDLSEDAINDRFWEDINMFYDDERLNLNKKLPNNIIAIADAGYWYGRRKECNTESGNRQARGNGCKAHDCRKKHGEKARADKSKHSNKNQS